MHVLSRVPTCAPGAALGTECNVPCAPARTPPAACRRGHTHSASLQVVGWYYIKAQVPSEQYKETRFILERPKILGMDWTAPISPVTSGSMYSSSDVEDPFEMV